MNSNKASNSNPPSRRAAWVASAVALVLAVGGGWLLSRSADAPRPAAGAPAPSAPGMLGLPHIVAKAEAAATPLPAASGTAPTPVAQPLDSFADALRKVQLTLQSPATPKEMLEAATILAGCKGADAAVVQLYALRDQPDPKTKPLEKSLGYSSDKALEQQQDIQRRCQVFDAATLARRGELLKGAYEGGANGSALPYLNWLNSDEGKRQANPELLGKLKREGRQSAEDGDISALGQYSLPFSTSTFGITEVQRQAYREAGLRIDRETLGAEVEKASRIWSDDFEKKMAQWGGMPPPLSPEQQREADALATKVVDAWRKRQGKGG